jgi:hypothetical protein
MSWPLNVIRRGASLQALCILVTSSSYLTGKLRERMRGPLSTVLNSEE